MSLETRLNDPEYQNWLKCGQALLLLVNSLRQLAEDTVTSYHSDLKQELGPLGSCQQQCKAKKKPENCNVCCQWKQKLLGNHSTKQVHWTNVDPKSWPRERWEVAKIYMARGKKPNEPMTADDLDSTQMFNLLKNCKEFHKYMPKKLPEKVLSKRNQIMHSSNMKLSNNDLKDIFDLFVQFLQDKMKLHGLAEAKLAVKQIQDLQKMAFDVNVQFQRPALAQGASTKVLPPKDTKDLEHTLISIMMEDFNKRLQALESMEEASSSDSSESKDLLKSMEDLQNFVNNNRDLKEDFGKDLEELKEKYTYLEEKVEEIEESVREMNIRLDAAENRPMPGAVAADYVSLLQQVTVELKIDKPDYRIVPEEQGKTCSVTVDGHTYPLNHPYRTKQDAKQAAAKIAYDILKPKIKSTLQNPAEQADDPANYIGQLQEYTQKHGLDRPEYSPRNKNTNQMQFTAAVQVKLSDGTVVNAVNPQPAKSLKDAKQGAAQEALKKLERLERKQQKTASNPQPGVAVQPKEIDTKAEPDGTNYKGKLQEQQQKLGLSKPTYKLTQENNQYKAAVTVPLPNDDVKTFECETAYGSKKEAEHAAAKMALEKLVVLDALEQAEVKTSSRPSVDTEGINYKGKLQERQQTLGLSKPTYKHTEENKQFTAEVTVPLHNGATRIFKCDMAYGSKKDAEQGAAKAALEKIVVVEELDQPDAKASSSKQAVDTGAKSKVDTENPALPDGGTNYKGKLQERQQTLGLSKPTYKHTDENNQFTAEVTVPLQNDVTRTFKSDIAYGSKKEAEHAAARKALEKLVTPDESKQSEAKAPLSKPVGATGTKSKQDTQKPASPDSTSGVSSQNEKSELQVLLMRSHGATSPPTYEDEVIDSQPKTFRSKVTISAKHMLQSEQCSSKKEAEKSVARLALGQLGIKGWEQLPNPKGKLLELCPSPQPVFMTEQVLETKQFQSTLFLSKLEKVNQVVIVADDVDKTKKEAQKIVAKKVLDQLKKMSAD